MFFSVIVPIYNIEEYLKRCIDSVLSQTFLDFELILVDDGSPDHCPVICDAYQKEDGRIKVIHKKNGGLVSARQEGMKAAEGEYIFHLDGDDYIAPNALESAYEIIRQTNAEIVSFSYTEAKKSGYGRKVDDILPEGFYNKEEIKNKIYPVLLCDENMHASRYFIWGRAIKRELIAPFQYAVNTKISHGEDVSCIVPCFLKAEKVYVSRKNVYYYTVRGDSLATNFKTKQITDIAKTIEHLHKYLEIAPPDFENQIARYSAFMCFAILALAAEGNHYKYIKEIKDCIKHSVHKTEIKKAKFQRITKKSRIGIFFMQKGLVSTAFCFLHFCKTIRNILRKG